MALREYAPGGAFPGVIGRTYESSTPAWPAPRRAREGIANVVFIVLDDTGFAQLGCYGSPIRTPNLDRLADEGLRYNDMRTTAICSSTRSCVLTGRNHHSNHLGSVGDVATGYPGYDGYIPFENGFLSEMLLEHGYSTYAVGKWHLTPLTQTSAAGPFDRWPLGRGFERFFGFLGGETNQYYPELTLGNERVRPDRTPGEGYHLTVDLVDHAIAYVADAKQVAPDKPFFLYFTPGAMHAPHHVPKEWADRYAGAFDDGWEAYREKAFARQKELGVIPRGTELSRHDPDVPRWDSLSSDERRLYARMMEVFAGFLEHTDDQIGRLLSFLERIDALDNTLIMVLSDNGASPEGTVTGSVNENKFFNFVPESTQQNMAAIDELGGPKHFNHYPWGWAWAGDAPFRRWKRETYRGGVSDPFIVHWPAGIRARGEIRTQFAHCIDMVPTVLDALELEPPRLIRGVAQSPIEGVSFAHTFEDAGAESKHVTQYFEMLGHRGIYRDGFEAVCPWPGPSFAESQRFSASLGEDAVAELDAKGWELYRVTDDFAQNHDVAAEHPAKVLEMIAQWYVEAGKYHVLPLDGRLQQRLAEERPALTKDRKRYDFYPGTQPVPASAAPPILNRPHSITALVEIPEGGAEGVLVAQGGVGGGYSFHLEGRRLCYAYNYVGDREFFITAETEVESGWHALSLEFHPTGAPDVRKGRGARGTIELFIDGKRVGGGTLDVTIPLTLGGALVVGADSDAPITSRYQPPFAFTGKLEKVVYDVSGERIRDHEADIRAALSID